MMREIWTAMQNADLTEGRGPMVAKGYFFDKSVAERVALTLPGVMGIGNGVVDGPVKVYDNYAEWAGEHFAKARATGLAKLTTEERRALGLEQVP
jgi:hypothetical protein